ncbi:HdeD family acid-resistance protein [Azospirillum thermophilum]|uniref:Protease n=1 Tax=Azospirillum thermophilum TaxID=2202148 RepID=A0A2S2CVI9_9PROT|nr:protease [Azospirillum thermophilum]AWK88533.1 protease [Azospirillum thermophilum]
MLQLAFMLIGPGAFRERWYAVSAVGAALIVLPLALFVLADGMTIAAYEAMGLIFFLNGLLSILVFLSEETHGTGNPVLLRGAGLTLLGVLILISLLWTQIAVAALFALAFAVDGLTRIGMALLVRFRGWRGTIAIGMVELVVTLLILSDWPLPHDRSIPFCVSLLIALMGWQLFRFGLMFRTLESEVAILALPVFTGRGWYEHAPVLVGDEAPPAPDRPPMTVHVWTPTGAGDGVGRRPLIDRYVAAVDRNGVISTGHAALEFQPHVYISHYPAVELDRSSAAFIGALRGTADNDTAGRFQPSYEHESDWWRPADAHVEFRNFSTRRLRVFWAGYRQDDTYNLTNRNCSVAVAAALEAALEGSLASRTPWLDLLRLMVNPDVWTAALLRGRAVSSTWTPGLVLDYARTLSRLVDGRQLSWLQRLRGFLKRLSPDEGRQAEAAGL